MRPCCTTSCLLIAMALSSPVEKATAQQQSDSMHASAFQEHLAHLVPRLLLKSGVPGAAVAVIRRGEVVFVETWGDARTATATRVAATTVFNVGSIAKSVTAWGVMRLVEQGKVDLDVPVQQYIPGWTPPNPEGHDVAAVTVRRLLSHTAGLSMPSVPGTALGSELPPAAELLRETSHVVSLLSPPGQDWAYSGGGYLVLQHLVEAVSGVSFDAFMRDEVLLPLRMTSSSFHPVRGGGRAQPYDKGVPAPGLQWPATAAADLNTTVSDLARFVAASVGKQSVLSPEGVALLTTPAPETTRPYTLRYGLGHDLWPLRDGRFAAGHNGQNTGWSAAVWWIPHTGDGIVVLTNDSHGADVHRWIVCDWVSWSHGSRFGGYCNGRSLQPVGTLAMRTPLEDSKAPDLRRWSDGFVRTGEPGGVLTVRRWGREIATSPAGLRDIDAGTPISPDTPFYVASVAKPVTAGIIRHLLRFKKLDEDLSVGADFPELPQLAHVSTRHLLDQTAGVPDYFRWINWSRFKRLDNAGVIDSLASHPSLTHVPGAKFEYSNSNYVLLAELVRRRTGRPLSDVFDELYATPLGLHGSWIDDSHEPTPSTAARGYSPDSTGFRLNSYDALDLPGPAPVVKLEFATTGAGGLYMSAPDLATWGEAQLEILAREPVRDHDVASPAHSPAVLGSVARYRGGWYVSTFEGRTVHWHDGNRGGHGSVLVVVPSEGLTIAFVTNRSDLDPLRVARNALEVMLK